jgi:1,4-dihydroxy-2-naphthoate octaprenyltransferase
VPFNSGVYRDKKVVGVFVRFSCAASVGVLNLNNMRDEDSDKKLGKRKYHCKNRREQTLKKYHYFIISTMVLVLLFFSILTLIIE